MPAWDLADLTLPEVATTKTQGRERQLALTILYLPDTERIGDVAMLTATPGSTGCKDSALSRREPMFCPPRGGTAARTLEDRYLSRAPVLLGWHKGELVVTPPASGSSLKIDGLGCDAPLAFSLDRLEQGLVLALANRVVLLLHWASLEPVQDDDCGLVGEHAEIQRLRAMVGAVAARNTPVLLLGESGTGKELVARAIHARSDRRDQALVTVNVAAIPEELAAAELFGVCRGAFTGAAADRAGYFEQAHDGTLFLDEIGACHTAVQAQLLRALQQGEIQVPGGGTRRVDTRVLAATDANLDGQFSTALRYRLGGVELRLPPLRERREDMGRLLRHFLPAPILDAGADDAATVSRWVDLVARLALHDWTGNVRELANVCQQIEIGGLAPVSELLADMAHSPEAEAAPRRSAQRPPSPSDQQVCDALLAARWEVTRAARQLQISRQALYRRMEAIPELRTAADISSAEITSTYHECDGDLEQAALLLQVSSTALRRRWRAMDLLPDGW